MAKNTININEILGVFVHHRLSDIVKRSDPNPMIDVDFTRNESGRQDTISIPFEQLINLTHRVRQQALWNYENGIETYEKYFDKLQDKFDRATGKKED